MPPNIKHHAPVRLEAGRALFSKIQSATILIVGLLLVLAGFGLVKFLLNFDQLQRLAEENRGIGAVEAPASTEYSSTASSGGEAAASNQSPKIAEWLEPLNRYRAMVGLGPVTADARLSYGDLLHTRYLAVNYAPHLPDLQLGADAHAEDPAKPGFTPDGAAAARASDVDWSWGERGPPQPSWAINNWMQVPFHRMQIINPHLRSVGYGADCQGAVCFAALNTGIDVDSPPQISSRWPKPLVFPPDGSFIDRGEFSAEWPDPLTACSGYTPPAGLPITVEFGHLLVSSFSNYSITNADNRASLEACAFNADTYVNPDGAAQSAARAILKDFGAIIIVPRRPMSPGRYVVALTAEREYSWSFSVGPRNRK